MTEIYISYSRRDNTSQLAREVFSKLDEQGLSVFLDVMSIPASSGWQDFVGEAIDAASVILALIGNGWQDENGKISLSVEAEITEALMKDKIVIPVLFNGATMSSSLPFSLRELINHEAIEIKHSSDIDALIEVVTKVIAIRRNMDVKLPKIFISHSTSDDEIVTKLVSNLQSKRMKTWVDHQNIQLGQDWDSEVEKALKSCDAMVLVLSKKSTESTNVKVEWSFFIDLGKPVIPIVVEECDVPFRLRLLQRVDFSLDYTAGIEQVLNFLSNIRKKGD